MSQSNVQSIKLVRVQRRIKVSGHNRCLVRGVERKDYPERRHYIVLLRGKPEGA